MKRMNQWMFLMTLGSVGLIIIVNLYLIRQHADGIGREYLVSINRIEQAIPLFEEDMGRAPENLEELQEFMQDTEYSYITGLDSIELKGSTQEEMTEFFRAESGEYRLFATPFYYYKVMWNLDDSLWYRTIYVLDGLVLFMLALVLGTLCYVRYRILEPFHQLSALPCELAKGNLTVPLQEHSDKLFGQFVWGMDLLREHLEQDKIRELELQRDKKVLLLSLSHDIKTPLSAIKLYAAALNRNLYQEEQKKQDIAEKINGKVDEIENYLSDIVQASNEDFLHFEVDNREFYVEEVLQNVIENAIKYGDGRRIRIGIKREEAYIIQVINTGCQLPDPELPHIFESFFRGSNSSKRPGSGLGLYICRQLMHRMEGEITAGFVEEEDGRCMSVEVIVRLA